MNEIEKLDRKKNILQWMIVFLFGMALGYIWGMYITLDNLEVKKSGPTIYYPEQMPKISPKASDSPTIYFN